MNIENSMCHDVTSDEFDKEYFAYIQEKQSYKSVMNIGNVRVMNTKHFNWLNKIMFKIFFGIKIEDYKEE